MSILERDRVVCPLLVAAIAVHEMMTEYDSLDSLLTRGGFQTNHRVLDEAWKDQSFQNARVQALARKPKGQVRT